MDRVSNISRETKETRVTVTLDLDGSGNIDISTGIPFFDHMLSLFAVHGLFNLSISASGDLEVDFHHTVEDIGLVLGEAIAQSLGDRKGIRRFGHSVTPMDDALTSVTVDLSNRPYLVYNVPQPQFQTMGFDVSLAREFFRAFSTKGGMNLHINLHYGENEHHVIESIFKGVGRAMKHAVTLDSRFGDVRSTKGIL
jgi:imidazoleglycerol-phosphate dehydratase